LSTWEICLVADKKRPTSVPPELAEHILDIVNEIPGISTQKVCQCKWVLPVQLCEESCQNDSCYPQYLQPVQA
jgi:hypothetical protein